MSPRPSSTKVRRAVFLYWRFDTAHGWRMTCQICGIEIHPVRDVWHADHEIVRAHDGSDDPPNVRPLCKVCHATKTYTKDLPEIAKGVRQSDSIYGVRQSRSKLRRPEGMHYSWEERRYVRD